LVVAHNEVGAASTARAAVRNLDRRALCATQYFTHMSEISQDVQTPEATAQGVCHTDSECVQMYAALTPEVKAPALEMLRTELAPVVKEIRAAFTAAPKDWYVGYHFGWGMAVRNLLREKGFGEEYFKIHNLDDIYVALVEEALGLKDSIPQGL
jgi:hypothetical protein